MIDLLPNNATWFRSRSWIRGWLDRHQPPEDLVLISTALLTGIATGFGAIGFIYLIAQFRLFFSATLPGWLGLAASPIWVVILPGLGGLLAGPLILKFAREAKGHGVPEVLTAVSQRGGRIRASVVVIKALASSICIGTGGSAGREGPIVQIGAALGSNIGQLLHLSDARVRNVSGTQFVEVTVPSSSWMANRPVSELSLPEGCVLVSIHRAGTMTRPDLQIPKKDENDARQPDIPLLLGGGPLFGRGGIVALQFQSFCRL